MLIHDWIDYVIDERFGINITFCVTYTTSRLTVENDMLCSFGHRKERKKKYMTFGQKSVQGYQHDRREKEKGLKDDRYPHIQSNRMRTG